MRGTITPTRYEWLIDRLGLNQSQAALLLGISDRQSRRFVAGDVRVDQGFAILLELMVRRRVDVDEALRSIGLTMEDLRGRVPRQARTKDSGRSIR